MDFSVAFTSASKHDAVHQLESAVGIPRSVHAFIHAAIDGFKEEGGNHPLIVSDDPALKELKEKSGKAVNPIAIKVEASGHLDPAGGESTCTIKVSKA